MEHHTEEEIFSYTFTLRKRIFNLPVIVSTMQILKDSGFNCFIAITGEAMSGKEKQKSRWLEIHLYERSCKHSTLTFSRLLSTVPSIEDEQSVSKINFAISLNSKVEFGYSYNRNEISIKLFAPDDTSKKSSVLEYFNLYSWNILKFSPPNMFFMLGGVLLHKKKTLL